MPQCESKIFFPDDPMQPPQCEVRENLGRQRGRKMNAITKREYSIRAVDGHFLVVDGVGERVSTCPTEEAARQEITDCERENMLFQDAKGFVQAAIETMMQKHGLDRRRSNPQDYRRGGSDLTWSTELHESR